VRKLGGSRLAWNIALYMGLQSFAFYVVLAWLPDMLQARGASPEHAGWMLSLSQFWGIVGSLAVPLWAGRQAGQRAIVITLAAMDAFALCGLLLQGAGPAGIWVSLLGFSLGGAFGLSLFMIGARSADAETAASLSGLAQSIGYLIAACGPLVAGSLFDLSGSWNATLLLLLALVAARVWAGMGAARPHLISH
ncbi:MAG: MFS transporter, partial [Bacteroidetes bacterium]|nr:MFS transporter [Bacteroidota bacterium]